MRKRVLKIRQISKTMEYANKECKRHIDTLNCSGQLCCCPICKSNKNVTYVGTNKGTRKFVCDNPHHERRVYFSTSTSYEAIEIYRETMAKNLCLLAHTNSNVRGITKYNETSKYFVEFALEALYEYITQEVNQPLIKIDKNSELITIFFDLSGSKLAKNKAIILAKIGEKVIFEIVSHSNYVSTHQLISSIKNKLDLSGDTQIVFVTDGERCFVDSIKHFFPNALHIRQFHSQSCKGIIYIHFKYTQKDYTLRCLWDAVLKEGKASREVIKHREFKAKKRLSDKEIKKNVRYSELSTDVILWEGTVYLPRGVRRRITNKCKSSNNMKNKQKKTKNTSTNDTTELLFKGKFEDAKRLKIVQACFKILKKIFGGLYITSNIVETIFNVKTKLSPHRTMKLGERILVCILYCHLNLKDKNKWELIKFIKERVITYELVMGNVLYGSGLQKNKKDELSFLEIIKEAVSKGKELIIHYCDRYHNHTSRIIKPLKIMMNDYNNTTMIEAFCDLRNEKRTFYLERIRDAAIFDPKPICI